MFNFKSLFEAFTSKVPSNVTKNSSSMFKAKGNIAAGLDIEFSAVQINDEEDVWDVTFKKAGAGANEKFALTNDGQALRVFSFVTDSIQELIAMKAPNIIMFTSEKDDGDVKRVRVYRKLIDRMISNEYEVKEFNAANAVRFILRRKL